MAAATGAARGEWSSRFVFLMAAIGSSVGLGNLWRFPFQTGENGGSAFVVIYLACVAFVAFPILIAEYAVGRHARLSAVGSVRKLAQDAGAPGWWSIAGWVGSIGGFLILTTYSIIAGQVMAYSVMGFSGEFAQITGADAAAPSLYDTTSDRLWWHTAFMTITALIVARGLRGGIERVVTVLMPLFFLMLIGLCGYSLVTGDAGAALGYLLTPRFEDVSGATVLAALGQAFFSIGVGSAIMITYGSYLPKTENIPQNAGVVTAADTGVALVAGLMIFPIVFMVGLDPATGAGLIFGALPAVFAGMPYGELIGGAFFFLAFIAALTSSISLLQVCAAWAEEHTSLGKGTAVVLFAGFAWFIGAGAAHSDDFGGFVDFIAGNVALPLGGLLIALVAGWVASKTLMREELPNASERLFNFWRFTIRFVAPVAVGIILVMGLADRFGLPIPFAGG